ncbi:MAG: DUF4401 domain-containing protein [Planctomycetota bacterium]
MPEDPRELLGWLEQRGLLEADELPAVQEHLKSRAAEEALVWYLRVPQFLGAWIAGILFMGFLFTSELLDDTNPSLLVWGGILGVLAVSLHKRGRRAFFGQLALALSVGAHGLLIWAAWEAARERWVMPASAALLCVGLYPVYRDALHRFLACMLVLFLTTIWLLEPELHGAFHGLVAVEALGFAYILTRERLAPGLLPLAYACAVSVPLTILLGTEGESWLWSGAEVLSLLWPSTVLLGLCLLWLLQWAAGGMTRVGGAPRLLVTVVTLATGLLMLAGTPGILAALCLMLLGHAMRDGVLVGAGALSLPLFLQRFYQHLELSLLEKSITLVGTGLLLLALGIYLARASWQRGEGAA